MESIYPNALIWNLDLEKFNRMDRQILKALDAAGPDLMTNTISAAKEESMVATSMGAKKYITVNEMKEPTLIYNGNGCSPMEPPHPAIFEMSGDQSKNPHKYVYGDFTHRWYRNAVGNDSIMPDWFFPQKCTVYGFCLTQWNRLNDQRNGVPLNNNPNTPFDITCGGTNPAVSEKGPQKPIVASSLNNTDRREIIALLKELQETTTSKKKDDKIKAFVKQLLEDIDNTVEF